MFIETYYDDRAAIPGSTNNPVIPYPELSGEELTVWRQYLPMRRQIRNLSSWFNGETIPGPAITEIEKAKRAPGLFDHIEIWSRAGDPMAHPSVRHHTCSQCLRSRAEAEQSYGSFAQKRGCGRSQLGDDRSTCCAELDKIDHYQ